MLEHLLSLDPEPLAEAASSFVGVEKTTAFQVLDAKTSTSEWLRNMGADDPAPVDPAFERAMAAQAFGGLSGAMQTLTPEQVKKNVMELRTPAAVRHTAAMLSEYDWQFVERANEIRGYVVATLIEETKNKKPEIRLKALKLLGDVTEVALFTQRTEIVTKNLTDEQLEEELNKRLEKITFNDATPLVERVDSDVDDAS
jgi:hypothetical protein